MSDSTKIQIGGIESFVRLAGEQDSSEAVLLLHGNPGPSDDWEGVLPAIGEFARAVAPDMPGYGQADRPRDFDYTVGGYAAYLAQLIDALDIRRVHLVLHDFGGPWGLAWASEHPDRVASLSLVNIGVLPGYRWHKFAKIWRTPVLGELFMLTSTRPLLRAALNADNPKPFPEAFIDRLMRYADWGQKRAVLKLYRATSDLDGLSGALGDKLRPLRLPCNVIWGADDAYLPVRFADAQRDVFDAQVHIMENCGHWPMIDEPERFRELLVPFLKQQFGRD